MPQFPAMRIYAIAVRFTCAGAREQCQPYGGRNHQNCMGME